MVCFFSYFLFIVGRVKRGFLLHMRCDTLVSMVIWEWTTCSSRFCCFSAIFVCVLVYKILLIVLHYNLQFLIFVG